MAKFIVGSDSNSVTNTGEAWIFRANDRPVGTLTQQLGGNGCSSVTWEIVDSAWSKVIASISNGAPGSSFQINSSGQVGMGTGNPMSTLDIYQAGLGTTNSGNVLSLRGGNNSDSYGTNQIVFNYGGGAGSNSYAHAIKSRHQSGGSANNALDFFIWTNANVAGTVGTKHVMTIDGTGGVGIGTCAPFAHNGNGLIINGKGSDTRGIIELWDSGASGGKSVLQQVGGDTYMGQLAKGTGGGNVHILTGGSGTSATISMTLLCAGNVGVGTTTPCSLLHLAGGGTGTRGALRLSEVGLTNHWELGRDNAVSGDFTINSNASEKMRITTTGKVAVGSTSPNGQFSVAADQSVNNQHFNIVGTQTSFSQEYSFGIPTSTKDLRIYDGTAGAVRLTLTCLGNLGLNTTTPGTYKLNVNGAFYAAGSSKEYKTTICEYNTDSCMFMKLKPVTYDYKEEWKHLGKQLKSGTQIGLIAEDTAEVFPEIAVLKEEENEQVVRNVDYEKLSVILLSEVQKLRREVDDLKHKQ